MSTATSKNFSYYNTNKLPLSLWRILIVKTSKNSFYRTGMIILNERFQDPKGLKFRTLINLHKKTPLILKDLRFNEDKTGDL